MTTAAALTHRLAAAGIERDPDAGIYTVLLDDHSVHCMTEDMLDAWWSSLSAAHKAEVFDVTFDNFVETHIDLFYDERGRKRKGVPA